jgi:AraC-like DNA-binding protein
MSSQLLFYSLGIVGMVSMLFLGIGFLKSQPKNSSAQLFFIISLCVVCYVVNVLGFYWIESAYRIDYSPIKFLIRIAPTAIPALFMMFCHTIFQEQQKFPRWLAIVFALQMALWCATWVLAYDSVTLTFLPFSKQSILLVGNQIINLSLLGFSAGGVYWTIKDWRNDLIEGRRILRWLFVSVMGLIIFTVVLSENFIATTDSTYKMSQQITLWVIALFSFALAILMTKFDYALLSDVIEKVRMTDKNENNDQDLDLDLDEFNHHFIEQKRYREAGLSIADLAGKLSMPEYRLRRLINKRLGFRNFSAMLHHFRIDDASRTLADRSQKNIPILTIALDVGYNSITPFNTAFRDLKGLTPSEFRKQALREQRSQPESTH